MMAVGAAFAVSAQSEPQLRTKMEVKPRFGFKAGVNLANLEIQDDASAAAGTNNNNKTSLHAGFFYQIPVTSSFRIQPELIYSIQGAKTNGKVPAAATALAGAEEIDLHYVSLPVMFQYVTPGGFMVEAGPQFSYLSSANADASAGEVNLKDGNYVKKIDFALGGGVGYTTRIGLGAHAKYMYGFTNIWNNEDSPIASVGMEQGNRVFQIGLHYLFGAAK